MPGQVIPALGTWTPAGVECEGTRGGRSEVVREEGKKQLVSWTRLELRACGGGVSSSTPAPQRPSWYFVPRPSLSTPYFPESSAFITRPTSTHSSRRAQQLAETAHLPRVRASRAPQNPRDAGRKTDGSASASSQPLPAGPPPWPSSWRPSCTASNGNSELYADVEFGRSVAQVADDRQTPCRSFAYRGGRHECQSALFRSQAPAARPH
jgi:hypothetical protein